MIVLLSGFPLNGARSVMPYKFRPLLCQKSRSWAIRLSRLLPSMFLSMLVFMRRG